MKNLIGSFAVFAVNLLQVWTRLKIKFWQTFWKLDSMLEIDNVLI